MSLTEGQHRGEFIVSEANGTRSRGTGVIALGNYAAGTVMGQITVSSKWVIYDPANIDGSEVAKAVLYDNVDASAADVADQVLMMRDCEVNASELVWFSNADEAQKTAGLADLAAVGIIGL